jgi:hypothetical protein
VRSKCGLCVALGRHLPPTPPSRNHRHSVLLPNSYDDFSFSRGNISERV